MMYLLVGVGLPKKGGSRYKYAE